MAPVPSRRYLLDTNILVASIRGGDLGRWIEGHYGLIKEPQAPLISAVTVGELRSLALQRSWGPQKVDDLLRLVGRFVPVPLDFDGVYEAYAEIDAHTRKIGRKMGKNDAWIAATARATGARLLTTDRDFDPLHPDWLHRDWIDPTSRL